MKNKASTNINKSLVIIVSLFLATLFSCQKDQVIDSLPELGFEYFPTNVGHYIVYDVDSIVINDFTAKTDTFTYQLMEIQESEFKDNENRNSLRIERYKRTDSLSNWKLINICTACRTEKRAEKTENNIKIIKLTFPVRDGLKWNGNAYNNGDVWNYVYENTFITETINGVKCDSTISVLQKQEFNLIESQYYIEKYAKHIGLVYKKVEDIKTEINGKIKGGIIYTQMIREFGIKN